MGESILKPCRTEQSCKQVKIATLAEKRRNVNISAEIVEEWYIVASNFVYPLLLVL